MPVTVGTPTAVYDEGTATTINKPSGVVDGDFLVAVQYSEYGLYSELGAPAGWTLVSSASHDSGHEQGGHAKVWTRIVSGDGTSYSFPHGSGYGSLVSITPIFGAGATPTLGWDVAFGNDDQTAPSVIAQSVNDAMVAWTCVPHASFATASYAPPSGMTETFEVTGGWASSSSAKLTPIGATGATGTKDFALTNATPRGGIIHEVNISLLVLDPVPPGPPPEELKNSYANMFDIAGIASDYGSGGGWL